MAQNGKRTTLLNNTGAVTGPDTVWAGGRSAFLANATFGGGSIKLQIKLPDDSYGDVTNASLTATGMFLVELPQGTYRAVATTATACNAWLVAV